MGALDDRLLPVFAAQHWLVRTGDIREAGGDQGSAPYRVGIKRWDAADVGVYHLTGAPRTWESRLLAPVLSIGGGACASHTSAAVLHGVPGFGRGTPEITIPRGMEHRRADVRVHTSTDLDRCAPVDIDGVPSTSLERTLLDVGRVIGDVRLLRSIEWARRRELTDWPQLIRMLVVHARRGRPGIQRMRRVIVANMDRREVTDSDFELLVLALLAEHGMPTPVLHHRIHDGERFVAEVDLAYPDLRITIELDGDVHLLPEVRERDLPRQNDLVLTGWTVLRFSYARLRQRPASIVAEVRDAIARAQRASAPTT
jgi:hypothetical protein